MNEDLDLLLGLESISEAPEQPKNEFSTISSINLLPEESEPEKSNLVKTPAILLGEYTVLDTNKKRLNEKLEEFKQQHKEIFDLYQAKLNEIADVESKKAEIKSQLVESMENAGLKNISNDSFKVTYVAATQKSTFDRKSFEKKYPVLCKEFISYSDVSAYVRLTELKKGE